MSGDKKIRLRPLRIISYLIIFLLDVGLYIVLQSYFLWTAAWVMVLFPVISIVGLLKLPERTSLVLRTGEQRISCGELALLQMELTNDGWYPVLDVKLDICLANRFFETDSEVTVSMPLRMNGSNVAEIPVEVCDMGHFVMECRRLSFQDLFGMVYLELGQDAVCEFFVMPEPEQSELSDVSGYLGDASETEESRNKGSDFAEVSDIREYIPGDRIRDIHWKLSAKQEELMVKERTAMAGSEMVILVNFSEDKEITTKVIRYVLALGRAFSEGQMPVCLLCWNQSEFSFEEYRCVGITQMKEALEEIFRTPASQRILETAQGYIKNCYPFLTAYLSVTCQEGKIQVVRQIND